MRSLVPSLLATLWADAEFSRRLDIKLSCDWQTLSLLKFANARPSSETEDSIDLAPVLSVALQSFLYLLNIVPLRDRWHSFADDRFRSERSSAWP